MEHFDISTNSTIDLGAPSSIAEEVSDMPAEKSQQPPQQLFSCPCSLVFLKSVRNSDICPLCQLKKDMLLPLGYSIMTPTASA